jgi:hypothetical protein
MCTHAQNGFADSPKQTSCILFHGRYFIDTDETQFLRNFSIAADSLKFLCTLHKKSKSCTWFHSIDCLDTFHSESRVVHQQYSSDHETRQWNHKLIKLERMRCHLSPIRYYIRFIVHRIPRECYFSTNLITTFSRCISESHAAKPPNFKQPAGRFSWAQLFSC